jgi:L-gulono-1,4-lactone dehydrogenase
VTAGWVNWAGNQGADCDPVHPRGSDEIVEVVLRAAEEGRRVRPIGSGHSFTGIGRPEGVQLRFDRHSDLVRLDTSSGLVTVQAGMPLHRLNRLLAEAGLGLTNLGDIDQQTVAGAVATGTHGTGAGFGGLATQVRGLELVTATGEVLACSPARHPEVFGPARVGLGALGVVSTVTLQAEPAFALRAQEYSLPLDQVLEEFDDLAATSDHVEFYWFPHTTRALVKRNTRVPIDRAEGLAAWRVWRDDEFLSNRVFGATIAVGRRVPALVRPVNRISARALADRTYTDRSHRVFTSPRRVRFVEMEYAVPREHGARAVAAVRRAIEGSSWRLAFPIEVRVAAADDIPLSTAEGRDSAYVAVHSPVGVDHTAYFDTVEQIMAEYGGRPHWGKLHGLDARRLRALYPRFDEFVALRDRLDPAGLFTNAYLDRVLGPPPGSRTRS